MQYVFTGIGTYKFKFEVRDSSSPAKTAAVTKTINVTTNLTNTSTISGQRYTGFSFRRLRSRHEDNLTGNIDLYRETSIFLYKSTVYHHSEKRC